jgi:hypothetical protein
MGATAGVVTFPSRRLRAVAEETWNKVELPILERLAQAELDDTFDTAFGYADMAEAFGVSPRQAEIALGALVDARFIKADSDDGGFSGQRTIAVRGLTEKGRRAVGQWPSEDPYSDLLQVLDARIEATADPTEKSKLRSFRETVVGMGRSVATSLLTEYIKHRTGI